MKVLVTGGASGLGGAITRTLAEGGASVTFTFNRSAQAAADLERDLGVTGMQCDYSREQDVQALIDRLPALDLDVLVHNAIADGVKAAHFHSLDAGALERGLLTNVMPVVRVTQAAIGLFRAKRSGRIITVLTSYLIGKPPTGLSAYVATKAYLHSLSKSWAVENARFGITSNCVSPSMMPTRLTEDADPRVQEALVSQHPLKRLLTPREAAEAVAFLAGPASAHVNGINLVLNAATEIV